MNARVEKLLRSRGLRLWLAVCSTLVMLALVYVGDKSTQSLGGEGSTLQQLYLVQMFFKSPSQSIPDDYVAINVGYDRELADVADEFGLPVGNIDITNRQHLASLLDSLRDADYKAILLDVNLDTIYRTPSDSSLISAIEATPRIVVSTHCDAASMVGEDKTGLADYSTNMSDNNFTKYAFMNDADESVALKAFRLGGGKSAIGAASGLRRWMEQPAVYLMLPVAVNRAYDENGDKTWYNLSTDILPVYDRASLAALVQGRTVVIGDFSTHDIHNTYAGDLAGPVILINAIETLKAHRNKISPWSLLLMAIVYLAMNLFFAAGKSLWDVLPWKLPRFVSIFAGMVSYTIVLLMLAVAQFALFDEFHDSFLVAVWLTICYFFFRFLNLRFPMKSAKSIENH